VRVFGSSISESLPIDVLRIRDHAWHLHSRALGKALTTSARRHNYEAAASRYVVAHASNCGSSCKYSLGKFRNLHDGEDSEEAHAIMEGLHPLGDVATSIATGPPSVQ
jgi:hypothetical protein